MTDRPIIFSAPMVNAILSGRKSMTRRILKPQPKMLNGGFPLNNGRGSYSTDAGWTRYSYAVGDRLWVREAFITGFDIDDEFGRPVGDRKAWYRATDRGLTWYDPDTESTLDNPPWKPSIHMPRWASRLTLIVTDVRVQRLQDISNEDAIAEGTEPHGHAFTGYGKQSDVWMAPYYSFAILWTSIHGPDAWDANPWVAAISFETHKCNIDQMPGGDHE